MKLAIGYQIQKNSKFFKVCAYTYDFFESNNISINNLDNIRSQIWFDTKGKGINNSF